MDADTDQMFRDAAHLAPALADARQAHLVALDDLLKKGVELSQKLTPELLTLHVRIVTCAEIVASLVGPRSTALTSVPDHIERRYDPNLGPTKCSHCGKPVEEARECYAIPTCYACLPPPPALPAI